MRQPASPREICAKSAMILPRSRVCLFLKNNTVLDAEHFSYYLLIVEVWSLRLRRSLELKYSSSRKTRINFGASGSFVPMAMEHHFLRPTKSLGASACAVRGWLKEAKHIHSRWYQRAPHDLINPPRPCPSGDRLTPQVGDFSLMCGRNQG